MKRAQRRRHSPTARRHGRAPAPGAPPRVRRICSAISHKSASLVVAGTLVALAGCGSGDGGDAREAKPLGQERAGSVAPLVQCRDWVKGNEAEKLATVEEIRRQINLEDGPVKAPPLTDEEAMSVFDNACSESFAAGFRLYVLYARAVGFAPLTR